MPPYAMERPVRRSVGWCSEERRGGRRDLNDIARTPHLHVGMVSYYYWPGLEGGAEKQCRRLVAELARMGVTCTVFTARRNREWPAEATDDGARIVRLPAVQRDRPPNLDLDASASGASPSSSRPLHATRVHSLAAALLSSLDLDVFLASLASRIRGAGLDMLHVHSSTSIAGGCAWLGRRLGLPVLIKEVTYPAFSPLERFVIGNPLWEIWRRKAYVQAQHAEASRDLAIKGVAPSRIFEIPNGIDMPATAPREEDPELVLFAGNLSQGVRVKGLDTLIAAWSRVARMHPGARLVLAGRGDPSSVSRLASAAGILDRMELLGHCSDLDALYRRSAIVVLPSRTEGMSNVLLEAMSRGVPVVATDIPGNRAVISRPGIGLMVPPEEPDAMADAIDKLLKNPTLRREVGEAARGHIAEQFEIAIVARRLADAYQTILEDFVSAKVKT